MELDGHLARRHITYYARYEIRRNPLACRIFYNLGNLPLYGFEASYSRTDIHTEPERIYVLRCHQSAVHDSLVSRRHGENREFVLFADERLVHPIAFRFEISYLTAYLYGETVCRKTFYIVYSTNSTDQIVPKGIYIITYTRQDSKACNHYSFTHTSTDSASTLMTCR